MKTNHNQFIRCVENIQDLSGQGLNEYALILGGGLVFSRKTIRYSPRKQRYNIHNHIDSTNEKLTERELLKSNIGNGMKLRSLIAIIK